MRCRWPLSTAAGPIRCGPRRHRRSSPNSKFRTRAKEGVLVDALKDRDFCLALLDIMARRRTIRGAGGQLVGISTPAFKVCSRNGAESLESFR